VPLLVSDEWKKLGDDGKGEWKETESQTGKEGSKLSFHHRHVDIIIVGP
jgi:hypothetical protein